MNCPTCGLDPSDMRIRIAKARSEVAATDFMLREASQILVEIPEESLTNVSTMATATPL